MFSQRMEVHATLTYIDTHLGFKRLELPFNLDQRPFVGSELTVRLVGRDGQLRLLLPLLTKVFLLLLRTVARLGDVRTDRLHVIGITVDPLSRQCACLLQFARQIRHESQHGKRLVVAT